MARETWILVAVILAALLFALADLTRLSRDGEGEGVTAAVSADVATDYRPAP
ncbi:MAG TPA: hypothetical protein VIN04_13930 [Myxococcota bacterium]